jgi:hypothetical protein
MSAARSLRLKQPTGWFAAGREVDLAVGLLSDAAFKVFVWLCLHADRSCGVIRISRAALATTLLKTEDEMTTALEELLQNGVCRIHTNGEIEISDRFWPYRRTRPAGPNDDLAAFLAGVRNCLRERCCVRSTFTPADEKLAIGFHQNGVSLADVQHAILLGCLRKYAAIINNGRGTPITSLHYFTGLISEVRQEISPNYWTYLAQKVRAVEKQWSGFNSGVNLETK